MHNHKILNIPALDNNLSQTLSGELGISKILAQLLINRGLKTPEDADKFLNVNLSHLLNPFDFVDMQKAVSRIKTAIRNRQRVMVFGDYDVDGITSLALLKNTLVKIGLDVVQYFPHRIKEGYGLNKDILRLVRERGAQLLITADCGTSSIEQISTLVKHNIDVIVTDHHEPSVSCLSSATATINPKLKDSGYKFRDLAGVGVAYKLCQALTGEILVEDLDLVCLGTIADMVPLVEENRVIVKEGLSRFSGTKRTGIKALLETSGIKERKITSHFVSYILGPRINASGRMDTADTAFDLLMSNEKNQADELAEAIESYNRQRQKIENKILEEASNIIEKEVNFKEHKIIVIAKEGWHQGVLGIVASKIAERFYRPTILISINDGLCKGSGRSIKNFHLFNALLECKDFLNAFGGHSHAVGLVIDKNNIEDFKSKINLVAKDKLRLEDLLPNIEIDMELGLADLNVDVISGFGVLEPFGTGNPEPLFYSRNLKLKSQPQVLGRETLKFWVSDGEVTYPAIGFGMGSLKDNLIQANSLDLVYSPHIDDWQGEPEVILEVRDIFLK